MGKVTGIDDITPEILKYMEEEKKKSIKREKYQMSEIQEPSYHFQQQGVPLMRALAKVMERAHS